jgi:hypothetical protein
MTSKAKSAVALDQSGIVDLTPIFAAHVNVPLDETQAELREGWVSVSDNDTHVKRLKDALAAGSNITLTEVDDGGDESLRIDGVAGGITEVSAGVGIETSPDPIIETGSVAIRGLADMGVAGQLLRTDATDFEFFNSPAWELIDSDLNIGSSAASFSITSIPANWDEWLLIAILRGTATATNVQALIRLNNNSTAGSYAAQDHVANGTGTQGVRDTTNATIARMFPAAANSLSNAFNLCSVRLHHVRDAGKIKEGEWTTQGVGATAGSNYTERGHGVFNVTTAISQLDVIPASGSWAAGSGYALYGRAY